MKSFLSKHASRTTYFCGMGRLSQASHLLTSIALLVSVGSFLWGYDSGIFATAQAQEYFESFFSPSPTMLGAIVSTVRRCEAPKGLWQLTSASTPPAVPLAVSFPGLSGTASVEGERC